MFSMWVDCMLMIMIMAVFVGMVVCMGVLRLKAAHACTEFITHYAVANIRTRRRGALAFDVMVVGFLNRPNFRFKAKNLGAVFAQYASWWW